MPKKISKAILYYFFCCMVISLLFLTGENLRSYFSQEQVLGTETIKQIRKNNELIQEKVYWENVIYQNPSYLPGYIELINLDIELKNRNSAIINLIKARQINPNSEKVKILEEILKI
jgi:hypothetical protein